MIDDKKHKSIYLIFKQKNNVKPTLRLEKTNCKQDIKVLPTSYICINPRKRKKIAAHLDIIFLYTYNNKLY